MTCWSALRALASGQRRTLAAVALAFAAGGLAAAPPPGQLLVDPDCPGPEDIELYELPPTCGPAAIAVVGSAFFDAPLNGRYARDIAVRVTDAHGRPVPNATVLLSRRASPDEGNQTAYPDIEPPSPLLTTGADGIARVAASANDRAGVFQYAARLPTAARLLQAYLVFHNGGTSPGGALTPVVEYYNESLRHYFITSDAAEMAALDNGLAWLRTGGVFMALPAGLGATDAVPVCRFYGRPEAGLDSHFFSAAADECASVEQRFARAWLLETRDAFDAYMPDRESGACRAGTRPLYRAYNNRPDANHRYALNSSVVVGGPSTLDPSWVREGYGPDGVAMCVPY